MKRIITILLAMFIFLCVNGQTAFKGFFRPVDASSLKTVRTIDERGIIKESTAVWLVRPCVQVSAMQFLLGDPVKVSSLSSLGTGISYSHFVEQSDEPYMNFAANFLVLFGTEIADTSPLKLSLAGTLSLWQHLNLGIGYSFYDRKAFLLSGISFNFN
jgi:hypothetical protein